jgi:multidrug efflux pump
VQLSELSVRRPVFATVLSVLLTIFGLICLERLAIREYPDIDRPMVSVTTRYPGASAGVIESKLTQVIEDAIAGIEGIIKIESESEDERSQVRIEFDIERPIDAAANDVRDRVARVLGALPEEADPPQILKADAGADPVMVLNFSSEAMSPMELTDYAERNLIDRLSTIEGVARASIGGARRYAMRIWIDRQLLAARQLTVGDIEDALRRENVEVPAGRIESRAVEFSLRTLVGLNSEEEFRNLVIARGADGHLVRLGEVATVQLAAEDDRSHLRANGRAGIGLTVEAQSKSNTLEIARAVREEVKRMQEGLPPGTALAINVDNGVAIEAALHEVSIAIVLSLTLVLLVIYGFLGSMRATLMPAVTIPVSIIATFAVMSALGYSINVLTLLGLVLAIGLVVDDAIVVLENIHRHMEQGRPALLAAVTGSREIAFAVIATTLTLVAVFIPISLLPGELGRLFTEFGFTLAAAVLFSALVALTLTPMLASKLSVASAKRSRLAQAVDNGFRRLSTAYQRVLSGAVRKPWPVIAAVFGLVALGGLVFRSLHTEFVPAADIGRLIINLRGPEGATLAYMDGYARRLEAIILKEMEKGDIERVMVRVPNAGGGGNATRSADVNSARAVVILTDWSRRSRSAKQITDAILVEARKLPGVRVSAAQPASLGRGFRPAVEAVIGGPDYEQISQWTDKLMLLAARNPGLQNLDISHKETKPQIRIALDRNRAAELGVSLQTVGRTLETVLGSRIVTTYVDRGREYNVVLQGRDDTRQTTTDITNIRVRSTRTAELIPLSNIVTLQETASSAELARFNRLRAIEIQADLGPGYTMGEAVRWFEDTVARELPPEAVLMWDGESSEFKRSGQQLYLTFVFALAIVYLVLAAQFESFVHPLIIIVTVPLALLGAVFGLKLFGGTLNIFSEIGAIMLIGIAAKNGVLIVEFANQLRDRGVAFEEALVQGAVARLRPVLMTSICTAIGALPFLLATGAGAEQRRAVGIVVFFGTLVAVFLTLLLVPAVYALAARNTRSPEYVSKLLDRMLERAR